MRVLLLPYLTWPCSFFRPVRPTTRKRQNTRTAKGLAAFKSLHPDVEVICDSVVTLE